MKVQLDNWAEWSLCNKMTSIDQTRINLKKSLEIEKKLPFRRI